MPPNVSVFGDAVAKIPSLGPGVIQKFTVVAKVRNIISAGAVLSNRVLISSFTTDPAPANNQATAITTVAIVPTFDITVSKKGFSRAIPGGDIIYIIQVSNIAIGAQLFVSLADIMPSGTSFVSLSGPEGWALTTPPVGSNGIITASIPILRPGDVAEFILVARVLVNVPPGIDIINTASLSSLTPDLNQVNNASLASTNIVSAFSADVQVEKSGSLSVVLGGELTYFIGVKNIGPSNAQNVILTDSLPSGLAFVSLSEPLGWEITTPPVGSNGKIIASKSVVESGYVTTFTLVVKVADTVAPGTLIRNTASIVNDNPVIANNTSTVITSISDIFCKITCPADITVPNTPGQCGTVVHYPVPPEMAKCGPVRGTPAVGSFFPIGSTTVTLKNSASQTCTFTITVSDTQPPSIVSCPAITTFCANSDGRYTVPKLVATDCAPVIISYEISGATTRSGSGDDASGSFNFGSSFITWTVKDSSNNTVRCQSIVTVNNPISVVIPNAMALPEGVHPNSVYQGYAGASFIKLHANVSGGTLPYTYLWSNGATTSSVNVSPTIRTAYSVTVTDASGCKQVSTARTIDVEYVKCGSKGDKVQVCIVPLFKIGKPFNSCVDEGAVAALLKAGSRLGSCGTSEDFFLSIKATPNPSNSYFTINVTSANTKNKITLNIYTIAGKLIETRRISSNINVRIGASYTNVIYIVEALQGQAKAKLIIAKL